MATTAKVLGQAALSATTNTDLYTVPAARSAVVSTINVCNRGTAQTTFRLAVRVGGTAIANAHYQYYDAPAPENDTVAITAGWTLATTDVITAYAGNGNLSVTVFGTEVS